MSDSFSTRTPLTIGESSYLICQLNLLDSKYNLDRLPFALKILLENLLRCEDGETVQAADIEAILNWDPKAIPQHEIAFRPSRVILQDFTGVPAIVDLAAMRDAMAQLGGKATKINPLSPVELVIDHSVMVDYFGDTNAFNRNTEIEFSRNEERYRFLHWGQSAFENFKVVPPGTGIVHQVNLEYLARVTFAEPWRGEAWAYPDTVVGTDSHTTMINGLGVLGWGVGGIEAEAAMLGQPITMLIPQVVGFELTGELVEGATATDLVLTVVERLRKHGVVGKFVEFFGEGLAQLPLADRATIANMAPEYGATCGLFPIDDETLKFLRLSGRSEEQVAHTEVYAKAQGLFHTASSPKAEYSALLSLDMSKVVPSIAGPKRPQDRIALSQAKKAFADCIADTKDTSVKATLKSGETNLPQGAVVIAAITSCTNTSNPAVMLAAGLVAKKAHALGLSTAPWAKTSLAPGSKVVTDYLVKAELMPDLEALGFNVVGYGCTTCIGNSGPLIEGLSPAIKESDLIVSAVLSGNRNFEGRVHPEVQNSYLASPPLVVAYALAGSMNIDLASEPLATGSNGKPVYLKDIWPTQQEVGDAISKAVQPEMFRDRYADVFKGDEMWQNLDAPAGELCSWDEKSTYVKNPPYFEGITMTPAPIAPIQGARVLALLGDSVTTDHISPAGNIAQSSPAGDYLAEHGIAPRDFNSYGSRRGNHEVMMRGTFANIRLRNQLAPGTEGCWTHFQPEDSKMTIFDAAMRYQKEGTPTIILAGSEYGTGSSRDWAAKGPRLLGVRAVIAQSFERIHRSNLIGMGVLPLQFPEGESASSLGLTGHEQYDIDFSTLSPMGTVTVTVTPKEGETRNFTANIRIDTPKEMDYFKHGGILHYVLRQLAT